MQRETSVFAYLFIYSIIFIEETLTYSVREPENKMWLLVLSLGKYKFIFIFLFFSFISSYDKIYSCEQLLFM